MISCYYSSIMKINPVLIWTEDGCWFQQTVNGVMRSSYLGHIGTPEQVKELCEDRLIDFTQKFDFQGTGIRERWPVS